jgi:hypothetical protein
MFTLIIFVLFRLFWSKQSTKKLAQPALEEALSNAESPVVANRPQPLAAERARERGGNETLKTRQVEV